MSAFRRTSPGLVGFSVKKYEYPAAGMSYSEDDIYRYLDKLHDQQKEAVHRISFEYTLSILQDRINVVFFDVTTVYFEIDKEDQLRRTKHQAPQVVLEIVFGLLVSREAIDWLMMFLKVISLKDIQCSL